MATNSEVGYAAAHRLTRPDGALLCKSGAMYARNATEREVDTLLESSEGTLILRALGYSYDTCVYARMRYAPSEHVIHVVPAQRHSSTTDRHVQMYSKPAWGTGRVLCSSSVGWARGAGAPTQPWWAREHLRSTFEPVVEDLAAVLSPRSKLDLLQTRLLRLAGSAGYHSNYGDRYLPGGLRGATDAYELVARMQEAGPSAGLLAFEIQTCGMDMKLAAQLARGSLALRRLHATLTALPNPSKGE